MLKYLRQAAAKQDGLEVFDCELSTYRPGDYVVLAGITEHVYTWAALGSYAFYEQYKIFGVIRSFTGDFDPTDPMGASQQTRDNVWELYNDVVIATLLDHKTLEAGLLHAIPAEVEMLGEITDVGGYQTWLEFKVQCEARLTVT
jgi:hypothetical protein